MARASDLDRRSFLFGAAAALLLPRRGFAAESLPETTQSMLEKSGFVYVSPLQTDGSESTCHGEVWFAWSEDPRDALGSKLRKTRAEQINKLAAMVAGLRASNAAGPASEPGVVEMMVGGFFGIEDFAVAASGAAGTPAAPNGMP